MMMGRGLSSKLMAMLILCAVLFGGALVQAEKYYPEIIHIEVGTPGLPDRAMLIWKAHPEAVSYKVYIRGFGDAWAPPEKGGKAGWYTAEAINWHRVFGLMPGNRYNFRIRGYNAEGHQTNKSEPYSVLMPPCWVNARYAATGVQWIELHSADPLSPPPEWAHIENTINCE